MKIRLVAACALALALTAVCTAQNQGSGQGSASGSAAPSAPAPAAQGSAGQDSGQDAGQNAGQGGYGRRGGRGGFGGGMGMGRGVSGTVTEVAADHYTVKSFSGDTYTVHFSANTRIMKQGAGGMRGSQGGGQAANEGQGQQGPGEAQGQGSGEGRWRQGRGGTPPEPIKAADIKVGDAIASMGEVDTTAKSVGATAIVLMDPERARQMQEMEANYGKTWLMGKVTAIDGVKVTVTGSMDNAPHSFVADENTTFRRRRDPITLADIQVGDVVRAEGAVKDGVFTAATVGDMDTTQGQNPTLPHN